MHRLFVAIRPPAAIRAILLSAMGGVSGARWQSEDQLHLTLRFIGEVDQRQAEDVHAALAGVRARPFEARLEGVGHFEHRGRSDTIWAGAAPREPLTALHHKLDRAIVRAGLAPERRAFVPHVTLARLGRSAGPIGGFLEVASRLSSPPFTIDRFGLYESDHAAEPAVYSTIEHYTLA